MPHAAISKLREEVPPYVSIKNLLPDPARIENDETPSTNSLAQDNYNRSLTTVFVRDAFQGIRNHVLTLGNIENQVLDEHIGVQQNSPQRASLPEPYRSAVLAELIKQGAQPRKKYPDLQDLRAALKSRPALLTEIDQPGVGLVAAFQSYRSAEFSFYEANRLSLYNSSTTLTIEDRNLSLGVPPWTLLNEVLESAGFQLRVISPEGIPMSEGYGLRFETPTGEVSISDLSSGEKTMVGIIGAMYSGVQGGVLPDILLLDEPDAHLHPDLTDRLLSTLHELLVDQYGVRVVMTTHSPSTVALAPDHSIFTIERGPSALIRRPESKWSVVNTLTRGLIAFGPSTKTVFVEDEDDAYFFSAITQVLESLDAPASVKLIPGRLGFIPASRGRPAGGRVQVRQWVEDLESTHIHGIVDGDGGYGSNTNSPRIHRLTRYAIENYLFDPLIIAVEMSREGSPITIEGANIPEGREALLATWSSEHLQPIIDHVAGSVFEALERSKTISLSKEPRAVAFIHGQLLSYPEWVLSIRGKDLRAAVMKAYGSRHQRLADPKRLMRSMTISRLIPTDLASLLVHVAIG